MSVIQIAHNAVDAKLIGADRRAELFVQKLLSYQVQGAETVTAFKQGHWDGRSSFYEMRHKRFPAGFVFLVQQRLTKLGYTVQIVRKPLPPPLGPEKPVFDEFAYSNPDYDYQLETANRLVKHGRMIAQIATGGGKSRVAQIATARILRPTLFLTTRSVLMYQMRDHFERMLKGLAEHHPELAHLKDYHVGVIGDGHYEPRRFVNVGMVQTFAHRLKEPDPLKSNEEQRQQAEIRQKTLRLLEMFEFVILEEAHEASGDSYYEIMAACKNAHYRLALTATPFMKEDEEANKRLMACSGPIGIKVTEKTLIDKGILARPYFKFLTPDKPPGLFKSTPWPRCYEIGVVNSAPRNAMIIREALRAVKHNLAVLILVARQSHGKILEKAMKDNGIRCEFIFGESDQLTRQRMLNRLANGAIQVLIGSTILDVGVDVPAIGMIIIASAGKAEVQFRQRIGRGLRRKKSGPNVAFIVDFIDGHNNILMRHSMQRRAIIQSTPGFAENILGNQDFDFSGFS